MDNKDVSMQNFLKLVDTDLKEAWKGWFHDSHADMKKDLFILEKISDPTRILGSVDFHKYVHRHAELLEKKYHEIIKSHGISDIKEVLISYFIHFVENMKNSLGEVLPVFEKCNSIENEILVGFGKLELDNALRVLVNLRESKCDEDTSYYSAEYIRTMYEYTDETSTLLDESCGGEDEKSHGKPKHLQCRNDKSDHPHEVEGHLG